VARKMLETGGLPSHLFWNIFCSLSAAELYWNSSFACRRSNNFSSELL